jgi:hypothetical protein
MVNTCFRFGTNYTIFLKKSLYLILIQNMFVSFSLIVSQIMMDSFRHIQFISATYINFDCLVCGILKRKKNSLIYTTDDLA